MPQAQSIAFTGRLTRDPRVHRGEFGTVTTLRMAHNVRVPTGAGGFKDIASFQTAKLSGHAADMAAKMLSEGQKVFVSGELQTERWVDETNSTRTTNYIDAPSFDLLAPALPQHLKTPIVDEDPDKDRSSF